MVFNSTTNSQLFVQLSLEVELCVWCMVLCNHFESFCLDFSLRKIGWWSKDPCLICQSFISWSVVYNCFFVETGLATMHWCDVIFHAVWKDRTWVTKGGFPEWGGSALLAGKVRAQWSVLHRSVKIIFSGPKFVRNSFD